MRGPELSFAGMAESHHIAPSDEVDLVVVTMRFGPSTEAAARHLVGVLSKYVVLTRMNPACRNVDLCASALQPGQLLVIEKWETRQAQREHFDSDAMVQMAESCAGLLSAPPQLELWEAASAHDLL
jgi:quinol monooxygenase YgiN